MYITMWFMYRMSMVGLTAASLLSVRAPLPPPSPSCTGIQPLDVAVAAARAEGVTVEVASMLPPVVIMSSGGDHVSDRCPWQGHGTAAAQDIYQMKKGAGLVCLAVLSSQLATHLRALSYWPPADKHSPTHPPTRPPHAPPACRLQMVPWHEGAELCRWLGACSVPARHLLYNHVGHADFAIAWKPLTARERERRHRPHAHGLGRAHHHGQGHGTGAQQPQEQEQQQGGGGGETVGAGTAATGGAMTPPGWRRLQPFARDLLKLVLGHVDVRGGGRGPRGAAGAARQDAAARADGTVAAASAPALRQPLSKL